MYAEYHKAIAQIISKYMEQSCKKCSIMEAGVGEATTLGGVLDILQENLYDRVYGFDISWSRVKYAGKFLKETFNIKDSNFAHRF